MNEDKSSLSSMCELIVDCPHSTPEWTDFGVVVLRNQNIKNGQLDLSSPSFTTETDYQSRIKRATPQAGDIVFTREAPMGEVCLIPEGVRCCLGQRQVLLRPKSTVDGQYLYWALQSPTVQHQISWNEGTGTTVSNVRIPVLKSLEIPRRGAEEPLIAKILSSLASKIQLNHQINQTLEQMAQAIFKSWFVDFEPVKAKMAAKESWLALQPAAESASPVCYAEDTVHLPDLETWMNLAAMQVISGQTEEALNQMAVQQPEQFSELFKTAALFPAAMQDSELGEIPEGWIVGALADVANLNQQSWTKRTIPSEIRYVDLANTKNGVIESTTTYHAGDAPSRARRILSDGDTIVGTVRPGNRSFAFIKRPPKTLTGSTGFAVLSPKQTEFAEFVYITASSDEAINHLAHLADGGAYPAVRPEVVINLPCIVPTERLIAYFHKTVRSFFDQAAVNKLESSTLSVLRDTLLPKLLSGELSVADFELEETADV